MDVLSDARGRQLNASIDDLQRQADELARGGDWGSGAEQVNRRLLELEPDRKVAMTRLARCLLEKGDPEAAGEVYGRLLEVDPGNVIASNFMRGVRQRRERIETAEREAATALRKAAGVRRPVTAAVSEPELTQLVDAVRAIPAAEGDYLEEDFVTNIFMTVLDVKMRHSTAAKAIRHYRLYRAGEVRSPDDLGRLLATYPDDTEGNVRAATFLWGNRFGNRVAVMRRLLAWLAAKDVTTGPALKAWAEACDYQRDVKDQVEGLEPAAYAGLLMRLGVDRIKPDVTLHEFVEGVIGHRVTDDELSRVMSDVARQLGRQPRQVDWAIREHKHGRPGVL